MVRHNNTIPNNHFHKHWKRLIKINFNQKFRKARRKLLRARKLRALAPRPLEKLRPHVHCPSVRYNLKLRPGRGFTVQELRGVNLTASQGRTLGIAVDFRRRNKSVEAMQLNVQRLKLYVGNLVVFPLGKGEKAPVCATKVVGINKVVRVKGHEKARVPTEEERKMKVFETLRKARCEAKALGRKNRQKNKEDDILGGAQKAKKSPKAEE